MLNAMIERETAQGFELLNRVDIAVATNSFRAVRGRPILCAIFDEVAFWRDEASAKPDIETYNAVKPGLATMPGSMIVGVSSPYRKSGLLHKKYKDAYGKPGDVLVIKGADGEPQSDIDPAIIARLEDPPPPGPVAGRVPRRHPPTSATRRRGRTPRRPGGPVPGVQYQAFCDPSGGASDSMTLAIGAGPVAVWTWSRASRALPDDVVASSLSPRPYRVSTIRGDGTAPSG
jgi:hypothetical protein